MIEFNFFQSPIGPLSVLAMEGGLIKISSANESIEDLDTWCKKRLDVNFQEGNTLSWFAKYQILHYLEGKRKDLTFPIIHINTQFNKSVLEIEFHIPYGETRSYGEVAIMINNPKAYRAVGFANAKNPLPIYFPCHWIIRTNGRLGGYKLGLKAKQYLLDLENQNS